jgi:tetratricopeptide (TPR) repeat protein
LCGDFQNFGGFFDAESSEESKFDDLYFACVDLCRSCECFIYGDDLSIAGVQKARRLLQIDPLDTGSNGNLGSVYVFTREWDKAIEQLRYAIELDPNYWFDYNFRRKSKAAQEQVSCARQHFLSYNWLW